MKLSLKFLFIILPFLVPSFLFSQQKTDLSNKEALEANSVNEIRKIPPAPQDEKYLKDNNETIAKVNNPSIDSAKNTKHPNQASGDLLEAIALKNNTIRRIPSPPHEEDTDSEKLKQLISSDKKSKPLTSHLKKKPTDFNNSDQLEEQYHLKNVIRKIPDEPKKEN